MCDMPAVKIGRPGYRVTKQFDPETKQRSLLFQVCIYIFVYIFQFFMSQLVGNNDVVPYAD